MKSKFNSMIGLVDRERVDTKLYDDYETEKAREVRELCVHCSHLLSGQMLMRLSCFCFLCSRSFTSLKSSELSVSIYSKIS